MTRIQSLLVLVLATLAIIVLGEVVWAFAIAVLSTIGSTFTAFVQSVPTWVWWVLFGLVMSLRGGRCRSRRACST